MKILLNFTFILLGSLSLIGCSYFDRSEELNLDSQPLAEVVDLTTTMPSGPAPQMQDVVSNATKGSVDIYPSDGSPVEPQMNNESSSPSPYSFGDKNAQSVDTISAVPVDHPPSLYSTDPSVDVFPLDGPLPGSGPPSLDKLDIISENTGDRAVVYFEHDATTLSADKVADVARLASAHHNARGVSVEGFASMESSIKDPVQRKIANLQISMQRAFSVARILIEKGVPAELIATVAYGETRPGASPAESRRVEIRGLSGQ
jgi:outer membrane protein OmpA-like peptidoglycan-associated protein